MYCILFYFILFSPLTPLNKLQVLLLMTGIMAFIFLLEYVLKCQFLKMFLYYLDQFSVRPPWSAERVCKETEKYSRSVLLTAISLLKHATLVQLYEVINGICSCCNYVAFFSFSSVYSSLSLWL